MKLTIEFKGLCLFVRQGEFGPEARLPKTRRWDRDIQNRDLPRTSTERISYMAHASYLIAPQDLPSESEIVPLTIDGHYAIPLEGCEVEFDDADSPDSGHPAFSLLDCMPDFARIAKGVAQNPIQLEGAATVVDLSRARPARVYGAKPAAGDWTFPDAWPGSADPVETLGYRMSWILESARGSYSRARQPVLAL